MACLSKNFKASAKEIKTLSDAIEFRSRWSYQKVNYAIQADEFLSKGYSSFIFNDRPANAGLKLFFCFNIDIYAKVIIIVRISTQMQRHKLDLCFAFAKAKMKAYFHPTN
ncbi:hypothetical protein BST86_07810 [Nonlabens agnitus]|uniref:Uncharacterized protein n=1 Tax=Nonlabens agnitus TaxID=870484 RepID=A0A2S9WU53_9FLAO|nr:hypothetical protein BST86_07810 [Nonlabens agnitus]